MYVCCAGLVYVVLLCIDVSCVACCMVVMCLVGMACIVLFMLKGV